MTLVEEVGSGLDGLSQLHTKRRNRPEARRRTVAEDLGSYRVWNGLHRKSRPRRAYPRLDAALNERRPEGYYGSSSAGYTDYTFSGWKRSG
jgi:hypothetical protein